MYNLIRKDFLIHYKMFFIMVFALFAYVIIDTSSIVIGITFSMAISLHIFAYDEKASIHTLLSSLPYTRKEIVSSRYISVLIHTFLVLATLTLGNLFIHQESPLWKDMAFTLAFVLLIISFTFPFSYKFKSQYLMIATCILFVAYFFIARFIIPNIHDELRALYSKIISIDNAQLILVISLLIALLYSVSWMLSIRIYSKKIF
ncbi:MAG: ABC-2 transporter permease [Bacillus sp. (in: firmicutes)]